jgi:CelD/BcsL family acetyltransferase involved in cellulose biosynthesis
MADVETRIIEDSAGFDALEEPWRELDSQPGVRPFQEFGWAAAWLRTIGVASELRLRVGTLWQGGRLIAVLPLCVRRYKGVRMLEWIGSRVTDYCDAIVDSGLDAQTALRALWKAISRRGGYDIARLNHVRTDARIFGVLNELSPWTETLEDAGGVPIVWDSGAEWLQQQSSKMRDRVKYNARRMAKAGFEVRVWDGAGRCAPIIDTLVAQKRPWLAARSLHSFINDPGGVEFLRAVVEVTGRRGEVCLSTVQSVESQQIAAVDLTFLREGTLYSYIASFDPQYAKYSFGRLLTDQLLMRACDNGWRRLDLLLGAYDYKTEYGCTLEPVRTLVLPRGILGHAAVALYRRRSSAAGAKADGAAVGS